MDKIERLQNWKLAVVSASATVMCMPDLPHGWLGACLLHPRQWDEIILASWQAYERGAHPLQILQVVWRLVSRKCLKTVLVDDEGPGMPGSGPAAKDGIEQ